MKWDIFRQIKRAKLSYTSLTPLLPETDKKFADIWRIVNYKGDLFFRSSTRILQFTNNSFKVYTNPNAWVYMGIHNEQVMAQDSKEGLMVYDKGNWLPFGSPGCYAGRIPGNILH
jgi:hypothetical protein